MRHHKHELKSSVRSLSAPVDNLTSNWAYMVMASLAWSLKAWAALLLPEQGLWQEKRVEEKRKLLRMESASAGLSHFMISGTHSHFLPVAPSVCFDSLKLALRVMTLEFPKG